MQVQIFNVAHGFCAFVVADTGNTMLIDCGHNDETGFYPANYLMARGCSGIERLFILNYDEDHLSGLPRLRQLSTRIPITILHRNPSLTLDQLRALKLASGPIGSGMQALLQMIPTYTSGVTNPPDLGPLSFSVYYNSYPEFTDTNNLSLVLFLRFPGLSLVFPGDVERSGWLKLLLNPGFREALGGVNIFIASHHGRESGYAPEVFQFCSPDLIVISDEAKKYETQEHSYSQHAKGITWDTTGTRKVLTTRRDGLLTITNRPGGYFVQAGG